jgi:hypothetical protein
VLDVQDGTANPVCQTWGNVVKRPIILAPRNDPIGFVDRTLKNLAYIEDGRHDGADVHVVTQLMLSLLGLIVFPVEAGHYQSLSRYPLEHLNPPGVNLWTFILGSSEDLGRHIWHLRNAVAHRHVEFSSDSRDPHNVSITFADHKFKVPTPYWVAQIDASNLRVFCVALSDCILAR